MSFKDLLSQSEQIKGLSGVSRSTSPVSTAEW